MSQVNVNYPDEGPPVDRGTGVGTVLAVLVVLAILALLVWGLAFLLPVLLGGWNPVIVTVGRYLAYGLLSVVLFAVGGRSLRQLARHLFVAQQLHGVRAAALGDRA